MGKITTAAFGAALVAAVATVNPPPAQAGNMSHVHMGHVTTGWKDTPDGKGLLPTAQAEADIAEFHAGLAAKQPGDLKWMQTHIRHVLHALDPNVEAKGPGKGYGVIKAAEGAAKHINFAADSADASKNVKAHAVHVSTLANNTVTRAKRMVDLSTQVLAATTPEDAARLTKQIATLAEQLTTGVDKDGNGTITWHEGEGGLKEAARHMVLMAKGEGLQALTN